jgi:hypothetical protein
MERSCCRCGASYVWAKPAQPRPGRPSPYCDECRSRCSLDGCKKPRVAGSSQCSMHKSRRARGMATDAPSRGKSGAPCKDRGCSEPSQKQGFCRRHYPAAARRGEIRRIYRMRRNAKGRYENGYREVPHPDRPVMVREHRLVMEQFLGRPLKAHETAHHRHGARADNRLSKLELWSTRQPKGQRIADKVEYALEILKLYAPELLAVPPSASNPALI